MREMYNRMKAAEASAANAHRIAVDAISKYEQAIREKNRLISVKKWQEDYGNEYRVEMRLSEEVLRSPYLQESIVQHVASAFFRKASTLRDSLPPRPEPPRIHARLSRLRGDEVHIRLP